jgi:hypothetical protein
MGVGEAFDPFERIIQNADENFEDTSPAATLADCLNGLLLALGKWAESETESSSISHRLQIERYPLFNEWSKQTEEFLRLLPGSGLDCYFQVGTTEVQAHTLRPHADGYALFETITAPPRSVYRIDFADKRLVAPDSPFDRPSGVYSDANQLYIGDKTKGVAVSLFQVGKTVLNQGNLWLASAAQNY